MKDSFILYTKYIKQIKSLSMEQRGLLFTAILMHEAHEELVIPELDVATQIAFDFICADLEENTKKYLDRCMTNAQNGAKGGRPKKQIQEVKTQKTERLSDKRQKANKADNDNEYDNDKDSKEKDTEKESPAKAEPLMVASREIVNYLNQKTGSHYMAASKNTIAMIKARMAEGHSTDDFKHVIDVKSAEWLGTDNEQYLRPETLFCAKHFESYLNQKMPKARSGTSNSIGKINQTIGRSGSAKTQNDELVRQLLAGGT